MGDRRSEIGRGRWRVATAFMVLAACGSPPVTTTPSPAARQAIVLISLDGFRPDYLTRGRTPHLNALASRGVRAQWMVPSFPSKTFPNHYTLVTGLVPDHHGIVSNNITDPVLGRFTLSTQSAVRDARWWGGEPIWVTAIKQGLQSGSFFWPGSEAPIRGVYPTRWMPFDDAFPNADRVDSVLAWLDPPTGSGLDMVTLYYSDVDHAGHDAGPVSSAVDSALSRVDSMIGRLMAGISARGLTNRVNVIVVADHGMAESGGERLIALDDYISMDDVTMVDWSPVALVAPKPGREDAIYQQLRGAHPRLRVYRKAELPAYLRYGTHPRVPSLVLMADDGWNITTRVRVETWEGGGTHGYDQMLPSMRALFVAAGPAFRQGAVVPAFSNVHVYELMTTILGLRPAPNDGSADSTRAMLK